MIEKKENNNNIVGTNYTQSNSMVDTDDHHSSKMSSCFAFSERLFSAEYLRWLLIVLLLILIFLRYTVNFMDYDIWWQMAHGRYYITHHTLKMDLSMFSWTPTNPSWIYNTCLGSIVVYLFYSFMGGFGLWLFQWLIFGGVFLSFYLFLRLINQRLDVNNITIIAAIGIACSLACRYYKPELFSLLLFSWIVFIFFYVKITRKKFLFYLYPLIFIFWVNLHGGFIVGLVFLAMAFVGELLNRIFFYRESFTTEELVHLGIAFILSGVAALLNPYGMDYLMYIYKGIIPGNIPMVELSPKVDISAYLSLWPYLKVTDISFFGGGITAWIMTLMIISVLILSIYEFIKRKSCDVALVIISVALYWKGMETNRAAYFFLVFFFFGFFFLLINRLKLDKIFSKATIFSLLLFLFFFISIFYIHVIYYANNKWFGIGVDSLAPVEEVKFLKKYKLDGPIFNDYLIGGYLVWDLYPDYKVFIDPRGGLYTDQIFRDYMEFTTKHVNADDIRRFREKYPFKIVILLYRQIALIIDFLQAGENEWRLLYFDKNAVILVHKSLLPVIESKIRNIDLSPSRFKEFKNPQTLLNVFDFYVRMDPKAGRYIYNVFEKNVSDFNKQKAEAMNRMDIEIRLREKAK
ncbi:MAG: hypothetical protein JW976_13660 [Syntrophaceae bacterium]|nr:hypothetical protein [Syntrophaceae bacterium]